VALTITIPDSLQEFIDAEVAAGGHRSAEEYIEKLVMQAVKQKAREGIEALVQEGLDSESIEWGENPLAELKKELAEYHSRLTDQRP
jgi:Arc/MetJ-type ribon-helix-helix transcriptional regulator